MERRKAQPRESRPLAFTPFAIRVCVCATGTPLRCPKPDDVTVGVKQYSTTPSQSFSFPFSEKRTKKCLLVPRWLSPSHTAIAATALGNRPLLPLWANIDTLSVLTGSCAHSRILTIFPPVLVQMCVCVCVHVSVCLIHRRRVVLLCYRQPEREKAKSQ